MKSSRVSAVIVAVFVLNAHGGTNDATDVHVFPAGTKPRTNICSQAERSKENQQTSLEMVQVKDAIKANYEALLLASMQKNAPLVMQKIIEMLTNLGNKAASELKLEQREYDRFMCWCENTQSMLEAEMTADENDLTELSSKILSITANLASCKAEIANLIKEITKIKREMSDARERRAAEHDDFAHDESETEATILSVKAAVKALEGVQAGASAALLQRLFKSDPLKQMKLINAVGAVRHLLHNPHVSDVISQDDIDALQDFAEHPADIRGHFMSKRSLSAVTVHSGLNPFGDYAPASTRIFGVLQALQDSLKHSLVDMRASEKQRQAAYDQIMAAKQAELDAQSNLYASQMQDKAKWGKELVEAKIDRSETEKRVVVQKKSREETTGMCQDKAHVWAQRTQLRSSEQIAYKRAINVLSGRGANAGFIQAKPLTRLTSAKVSLMQRPKDSQSKLRQTVSSKLLSLAKKFGSFSMTKIATNLQRKGGIFNDVIEEIDAMIVSLRREETDDIAHRDRCEKEVMANSREKEQIEHDQAKLQRAIESVQAKVTEKENKLMNLDMRMKESMKNLKELKDNREQEHASYVATQANQLEAISYLKQASVVITKFFDDQAMPIDLVQSSSGQEEQPYNATNSKVEPMPSTSFDDKDGQGYKKLERTGVTMVVNLIQQTYTDLEHEVKMDTEREKQALAEYERSKTDREEVILDLKASRVTTNSELADVSSKITDQKSRRGELEDDLSNNAGMKKALETDCAWVEVSFDQRRAHRKEEMDGLEDAKRALAQHQIDEEYGHAVDVIGQRIDIYEHRKHR